MKKTFLLAALLAISGFASAQYNVPGSLVKPCCVTAANGGTGTATAPANQVFSGPTSGGATTPSFRALVSGDLPAGTGTVTTFSAGNLSPLFSTSVANPTTTPALTFSLTNAGANTLFGNISGGSAAPSFTSTSSIPLSNFGLGIGLTGYLFGNGASPITASSTIPNTAITGLGTTSTRNLGVSVDDPGTGALEYLIKPQAQVTGTSKAWSASDYYKFQRRANGGVAMTDTLPCGTVNGQSILIQNEDVSATDTISLSGCNFVNSTGGVGLTSATLTYGRRTRYVWDSTVPAWRAEVNNNNVVKNVGTVTLGNFPIYSSNTNGQEITPYTGTGYVKATGGSAITSSATVPTTDLSGTLQAAQEPAHTGDVTNTAGSLTLALGNIQNDVTQAGDLLVTNIAAPATPASGKTRVYVDSTSKNIAAKNDAGTINHGVQTQSAVSNNFLTSISDAGAVTVAQPSIGGISGLGTGVSTALGTNVGTAGSFVVNGGALGTPSSGTLTNATGLPISTGVSGLGTGVATFLGTPTSANLASALTDETGSGGMIKNVAVVRFGSCVTWLSAAGAYGYVFVDDHIQFCTTGVAPLGENNVFLGGLIANNGTGLSMTTASGAEAQVIGVAFDDNTTTAINVGNNNARISLSSTRFENAGGGTATYITQSAGSVTMAGGSFQDDVTTGTSTGYVQQTGGVSNYTGVWHALSGRVLTQAYNITSPAQVTLSNPLIAPGSSATSLASMNWLPTAYNQSLSTPTATSSTTETVIFKRIVPLNTTAANQVFNVTAFGTQVTANTGLVWKLHYGPLGTTADPIVFASTTVAVATAAGASLIGQATIRTVGATGTIIGNCTSFGTTTTNSVTTATVLANSTQTNILTLTATAAAGTLTVQNATISLAQPN